LAHSVATGVLFLSVKRRESEVDRPIAI
jgi:hypothetical protein